MSQIHSALAWAAVEKYLATAVGLVQIAVLSRILTPHEIGVAAIGVVVIGLADALRDFGVTAYLIQRRDLSTDAISTTFTILLTTSVMLILAMATAAPSIATAYGDAGLSSYIWVLTASFACGPFAGPLLALMRRDMEFGKLAAVGIVSLAVNAVVAIGLALAGYSFMSFAWAGVAASFASLATAIALRPQVGIYRLRLTDWRTTLSFGTAATATAILNRAYEALPLLLLGRILTFEAVGVFQRATVVCQIPDRLLSSFVGPVALPAFAAHARDGASLKDAYLRAVQLNAAVQWPAYLMIAALAYPIVRVLLGTQWMAAAPLVQIMAIANLAMVGATFTFAVLVAAGRIQTTVWMSLISLPLSVILLVPAAAWSLEAVALSYCATLPLQAFIATLMIKRHIPFTWGELGTTLVPSFITAACTIAGPAVVIAANDARFDISIASAAACALLALPGWLAGLWISRHPLLDHLREAILKPQRISG